MNVVFLSPHFPPTWDTFCFRLKELGANVLAIADVPYEALSWELRHNITEYYHVQNMHYYDDVLRGLGYFTHRYGKIDRLDSHNEYWLETEARLRTDFNVPGITTQEIDNIKRKSVMKQIFIDAELKPARGKVCQSAEELRAFIKEVGYPVVCKPDVGVGAAKTYKLRDEKEVEAYLNEKPEVDYITEEFIDWTIVTYDGLTDRDGDIVFDQSLRYDKGVMDAVNFDDNIYYYTMREIEKPLLEAGAITLKAFNVRERFFHFEYFLSDKGEVIPMEVNIRPPGGPTLTMYNYASSFDSFKLWAELIVNGECAKNHKRNYHIMYVGRKNHIPYVLGHDQVLARYDDWMAHHQPMAEVLSRAMGNYCYILRHEELQPLIEAAEDIQKRSDK